MRQPIRVPCLMLCTMWYIAFAWLLAPAAVAQDEGPAVPIEKAPFHLPVFKNELVTVLRRHLDAAGLREGLEREGLRRVWKRHGAQQETASC